METLKVICPDCNVELIVDKKTGEVLETHKPLVDDPSGDRFEDARKRVLGQSDRAQQAFEEARQREKEKLARLDALFKEKAREMEGKPVERPDHLFDRD